MLRGLARLLAFVALFATCWAATPSPAPVPVPVGTKWYGDDGTWSPVNIRVGTPPQWLSVYPNTASQETWVIGPGGCDDTFACQESRGGIFQSNQSSTWTDIGYYELGFDPQLGDSGDAGYGLDFVDLSDQTNVPGQVVGVINTTEYWLGQLGLGVQASRFTGTADRLTFLSSLVQNQSVIPSHSYGYTAGAYYRLKNVPASLTLGGVDTNRFSPNGATFQLAPNQQPVVAINSITVSNNVASGVGGLNWTTNPLQLMKPSQADLFTIDSSTPFLWLPEAVCDSFAGAFNLQYNDSLDLYFYTDNGTTLNLIQDLNVTFVFDISDLPGSSNSIAINLPYDAFDLQLSFPYPGLDGDVLSAPLNYFPLRRAPNNTQYTIGRSFLQEAYLAIDYERNNFSVSQAQFALDSLTNINLVPITRPENSNYTGPAGYFDGSSGLSTGAEVGIGMAVAVLVLVAVALSLYFFVFRKRRQQKELHATSSDTDLDKKVPELFGDTTHSRDELPSSANGAGRVEIMGDRRHPTEMVADSTNTRFEMPGTEAFEMAAAEVPSDFLSTRGQNCPIELDSMEAGDRKSAAGPQERRTSNYSLPRYSQTQMQLVSSGISPDQDASDGHHTFSSDSPGISPVGANSGSQTSDPIFSPVSPNQTMPAARLSAYKLRGGGSRKDSGEGLLVPQAPERSASRSSRFREDLDGRKSEEVSDEDRKRFSWEE